MASNDSEASEFAHRLLLLMEQRAKRDPYTGRLVITMSPEAVDAAFADMGMCHVCGEVGCDCPRKRLHEFTPEEQAEMQESALQLVGMPKTDTRPLISPDGKLEIRFVESEGDNS